ncbi:glycosyltransferase N-terminal domain-containing protein [Kiritimatiellaeota bacterium B1221]|nr:glycosyltransferase N-terminal domain-containing protein [Kiritimatiellaeota bacterium B1221]
MIWRSKVLIPTIPSLSVFWLFYNFLFHMVYLLMLPHFLLRMRRRGGYRKDFGQRLFRLSEADLQRVSEGRKLWVHAVSVGELSVGLAFIREWRTKHPEMNFLVTVNTSTAHKIAEEKLDARDVLLYPPLDSPWVIRKLLKTVDVQGLVLVETEMWPNLLRQLHQKQIPVMLLNGRISDRSYGRLLKLPFYTQRLYKLVSLYAMQSEADAERARGLGAPADRVQVMHSAKYDVASRNMDEEARRRNCLEACGFLQEDSVVLLGSSTWPGEEKVLMEFFKQQREAFPQLRLILVPRHFERREEVKADADALGLSVAYWSAEELSAADVLMVDTTGELMHFTGLADLVFVGKSLFRSEGQNPLEAANAGKVVITGPGMNNFKRIMQDLREADAVTEVQDTAALIKVLEASLQNMDAAEARGERAASLVQSRKGSLGRSVDAFQGWL